MMDNFTNIENFGIDLKLETEEAEMFYPFDVIVENEIITVESEEDLDRLEEVCD